MLDNYDLDTFLEDSTVPVCLIDIQGNFVKVNKAAENATGYEEKELLSRPIAKLFSGLDNFSGNEHFLKALTSGKNYGEIAIKSKSGKNSFYNVFAVKINSQLILSIAHNVIEQRNTERFLFLNTNKTLQRVDLKDIMYIKGHHDYVKVYTQNDEIISLLSLKKLESILKPPSFIRIHKSYIVAINKIDIISNYNVKINNRYIPIGNFYKEKFNEIINSYRVH